MSVLPLELTADIPEGWTPLEVVSVIKCLDNEGKPSLSVRTSGGLTEWDIGGMLLWSLDQIRAESARNSQDHHEGP